MGYLFCKDTGSALIVSGKSYQDKIFCRAPRAVFTVSQACAKKHSFGVENEKWSDLGRRASS